MANYYTLEEISANKKEYIKSIYSKFIIYFLFQDEKLVYIGKTTSLESRLNSHKINKKFNFISIIEVNEEDYNKLEKYYINEYKPQYNLCLINKSWLPRLLHKRQAMVNRKKGKYIRPASISK